MKKITITLLLLSMTVLSGCFGGDEEVIPLQNGYKTGEFQINTPEGWEIFTKNYFTSDIPKNTELILRSKKKDEVFIANINVTRNIVADDISSEDYAKKLLQSSSILFLNFKKINEKKINQNGYLVAYQGKQKAGDPLLEFIQHVVVKDKKIFIATLAYNPADDEQVKKEAAEIISSLTAIP